MATAQYQHKTNSEAITTGKQNSSFFEHTTGTPKVGQLGTMRNVSYNKEKEAKHQLKWLTCQKRNIKSDPRSATGRSNIELLWMLANTHVFVLATSILCPQT
jgi:hypothetical protein